MSIIRLNLNDTFQVDSTEYEILVEAANKINGVPGAVLEIGSRRGGSAVIMMDALAANKDTSRPFFCVDPYGNIEIFCTNKNVTGHNINNGNIVEGDPESVDHFQSFRFDYTNEMRNRVLPSLYYYAFQRGFNFAFFCLEDTEFFARYGDGVPIYNEYKELINQYALVFFDGPHTTEAVHIELDFFIGRDTIGTMLVFDDIWMYDHDSIETKLFASGYETLSKGTIKASYQKVK